MRDFYMEGYIMNGSPSSYNRDAVVQYAHQWWNSYNPEFPVFEVDCTNYVSQCVYAGGASMRGAPAKESGWWCTSNSWSLSWSVSHSLYWFLKGSTTGLRSIEM